MSEISTYPQEWLQKALGEVCQVEIGGTPSRNVPRFWADEGQEGYPWAAISDLGPKWIYETAERITQAGVNNSNVKLVPKGTVLMSFKLTLGRVGITGIHLYTNEAIAAFYPDSSQVFAGWLYHVLPKVAGTGSAEQAIKGQTLNKDKLQRLMVRLPPLSEQRQIAEILDAADEAIRQTERLIAKLKVVKAGLLHDLLTRGLDEHGRLRDPQAHPEHFKDSPLGRIPREWTIHTLHELAESAVDGPFGSNLKTEHYVSQPGVRVVRLQNIESGYFDDTDKAYISESHARTLQRHKAAPGDLIVASLGDQNHPFARACLYPTDLEPGIVKADCFRFCLRPSLAVHAYVMYVLNCPTTRGDINALGHGVTRDRVTLTALLRVRVPVPSIVEQSRIADVLEAHDARIRAEEAELAKLRQVKRGLMDDLLSGRVRVV